MKMVFTSLTPQKDLGSSKGPEKKKNPSSPHFLSTLKLSTSCFNNHIIGVPTLVQWDRQRLCSTRTKVPSLAWHNSLKDLMLPQLWRRSQLQLGSDLERHMLWGGQKEKEKKISLLFLVECLSVLLLWKCCEDRDLSLDHPWLNFHYLESSIQLTKYLIDDDIKCNECCLSLMLTRTKHLTLVHEQAWCNCFNKRWWETWQEEGMWGA